MITFHFLDEAADQLDKERRKPDLYWGQAREPFACLIFLLPLLLIYEFGVLAFSQSDGSLPRNGADFWMRSWLKHNGIDSVIVLPLIVVAILLIWHRYGGYKWRISRDTLVGMFGESVLFAVCLLFVAQLQDMAFQCWFPAEVNIHEGSLGERPMLAIQSGLGKRMISYVGAGVYEEVMFRLALLPACLLLLRSVRMPGNWAAVLAVIFTSLIFSACHYVGAAGESFSLFSFTFRTTAGCFFATLFLLRGFGITVGCHALYDIMVGILTA
jgi:hypothetical protein